MNGWMNGVSRCRSVRATTPETVRATWAPASKPPVPPA